MRLSKQLQKGNIFLISSLLKSKSHQIIFYKKIYYSSFIVLIHTKLFLKLAMIFLKLCLNINERFYIANINQMIK